MANLLTSGVSSTTRSVVRQLEDLLPQIEDGLARGYSHAVMHAALPSLGINISLAYYHRALRLLRKERREGKQLQVAQYLAPIQLPDASQLEGQAGDTKASNVSAALTDKASVRISDISAEQPQIQPFRWNGLELINKDWSNF